ncbi:TetR/AcrR family transcriptional regulator [Actinokineospora inagensis]|uniref:TetR/AcrR family transcriptional regulator n=1 Tax=Actinokineospora inagensis TaxID=103730 RepID=UPI00041DDF4F|nr:TetR/AcrR family transcriptional regulator [Actinokineospora inagensis]
MPRRNDTRDRTLRTAVDLFRVHGYHGTGLNQVLAAGGLPKGSLYFHFPGGKEQLAAEAVTMAGAEFRTRITETFDRAATPADALADAMRVLADELTAADFAHGCPIGTVAIDADSDRVRAACADAFAQWHSVISAALHRSGLSNADTLATAVLSAVEGAQLLARNRRDTTPLYAVAETFAPLLKG